MGVESAAPTPEMRSPAITDRGVLERGTTVDRDDRTADQSDDRRTSRRRCGAVGTDAAECGGGGRR